MDRHTAIDLDYIKRIAALLLALALLSERAATRPLAVRMYVHRLLLNAQCAALALFLESAEIEADAAREASPGIEPPAEPCDLIRIAVGLRALAMLLAAGCNAQSAGRQRIFAPLPAGHPRIRQPGSRPARLNDTS